MLYPHAMVRRGFTLVELLVATGVFVIGFAAVFSLFLSGMRFRKLADDTTMTATLASSLLTEIYLDSGRIPTAPSPPPPPGAGPAAPDEYDGDGFGHDVAVTTWDATPLYSYAGVPGTSYRIAGPPPSTAPTGTVKGTGKCCDLTGGNDAMATAIVADVVALCPGDKIATLGDLDRRLRISQTTRMQPAGWAGFDDAQKAIAYENELVARGVALRYRAVIIRQPHWMP